jgi:hypothetical protein
MTRTLRACTLAFAASLISLTAAAAPVTAPDGSFTIDVAPAKKWKLEVSPVGTDAGSKLWVAGDGEQYCYFNAKQRADTANSGPGNVIKSMQPQLSPEKWVATAQPFFDALFSKSTPSVKTSAVETVAGWPVQTVTFDGYKYGPVLGALHMRPGFEVQAYCAWEDGKDHSAEFKAIVNSVATSRDAAWQAEVAAGAATPAPVAPPPPPPPPPAKKK